MCRAEGMAVMPYGVLGQGKIKSRQEIAQRRAAQLDMRSFWRGGEQRQSEQEMAVSESLEQVALELGVSSSLGQIAVAYHLQKYPYVFPVLGCRTVEQMQANVEVSWLIYGVFSERSRLSHG